MTQEDIITPIATVDNPSMYDHLSLVCAEYRILTDAGDP